MAVFDPMDIVRKTFLAGVGAVATGAEKSQELVGDLVKKGELTVAQGKALNEELTRKATEAFKDSEGAGLRSHLETMSAEERAAYAKKVSDIISDLDTAERETKVDADVEDVTDAEDVTDEGADK